jgi:hypothetical protein
MGDISQGEANTLYPAKKIYKNQNKREKKERKKIIWKSLLCKGTEIAFSHDS